MIELTVTRPGAIPSCWVFCKNKVRDDTRAATWTRALLGPGGEGEE